MAMVRPEYSKWPAAPVKAGLDGLGVVDGLGTVPVGATPTDLGPPGLYPRAGDEGVADVWHGQIVVVLVATMVTALWATAEELGTTETEADRGTTATEEAAPEDGWKASTPLGVLAPELPVEPDPELAPLAAAGETLEALETAPFPVLPVLPVLPVPVAALVAAGTAVAEEIEELAVTVVGGCWVLSLGVEDEDEGHCASPRTDKQRLIGMGIRPPGELVCCWQKASPRTAKQMLIGTSIKAPWPPVEDADCLHFSSPRIPLHSFKGMLIRPLGAFAVDLQEAEELRMPLQSPAGTEMMSPSWDCQSTGFPPRFWLLIPS
jgi:hypothetical protein